MKDVWPEVLQRLEAINRASWLVASDARVLAFEGDVLTLGFQSQADVAAFKKLNAGAGPSEDLRAAIIDVLGVRVKYLARHDRAAAPLPGAPEAPGPGWRTDAPAPSMPADDGWYPSDEAPPEEDEAPEDSGRRPAPRSPQGSNAGAPTAASSAGRASRSAPAAAAPVTDWAVAAIPGGSTPLSVSAPAEPAPASPEPEPDPEPDPVETEQRPTVSSRSIDIGDGRQRYGEAVVRQVLGATFVREEPYEPPTRFA